MHLKSLELTGFKSFAEGKIEFPLGVTAVVGPNGSGKSNVVDSILWVLGEQSTKTLRSERMEDVIFNGTEARKPLGMAEVSLILSGLSEQHVQGLPALPVPVGGFHEVMVTRRLYRNGDSEYLINKTLCRLKDVRSLLLDTRAGSKGHTIIEQGRIEQILNASPQDRRELIEETAGIVRYKKQKAEALRKLDHTTQDLLRVRDIIAEVQRQLTQLDRQARQARAFQSLQDEAKLLEIRLLVRDHERQRQLVVTLDTALGLLDTEESAHLAQQAAAVAEQETLKLQAAETQQALSRLRDEVAELERQQHQAVMAVEVERSRLDQYRQRQLLAQEEMHRLVQEREQGFAVQRTLEAAIDDADVRLRSGAHALAALEREQEEIARRCAEAKQVEETARQASLEVILGITKQENQLQADERQLADATRRAERLGSEAATLDAQAGEFRAQVAAMGERQEAGERQMGALRAEQDGLSAKIRELDDRGGGLERNIVGLQETVASVGSRLETLTHVLQEDMGYGRREGEGPTLRSACAGVREAVAEWLVVPSGYERAIDAVLGDRVRAWLVDHPNNAKDAITFLKQHGLGRGAFLPACPRWSQQMQEMLDAWWAGVQGRPGVVGRAEDLVSVRGQSADLLRALLQGVVIVHSLDVAMQLWEEASAGPGGPTLVTVDGEVVDQVGIITGGTSEGARGILQRRREVEVLTQRVTEARAALEEARATKQALAAERAALGKRLHELGEAVRHAESAVQAVQKDAAVVAQQEADVRRRLGILQSEAQAESEEQRRLRGTIETGRLQRDELAQQREMRERQFASCVSVRQELESTLQALQERVLTARLEQSQVQTQREHYETDRRRLAHEEETRQVRMAQLEEQQGMLVESVRQSEGERDRNMQEGEALAQRATVLRAEVLKATNTQAEQQAHAGTLDERLQRVREALAATQKQRTDLEVRRAEARTQVHGFEATLAGTYQLTIEQATIMAAAAEPETAKKDASADPTMAGDGEAATAEADPEQALRERLLRIRTRLERMGPINLAAIDEHRALEERHRFLSAQEADLVDSIKSLKEIIARINRTTKQMFLETFNELQQKFGEVFMRFFPGGRAELMLVEPDPGEEGEHDGHREPGVDIVAQPPGKRLKSITMLSGGEKTLTAMALIFASFLIRPTPFCILDEIDAPLDEENIGRFTTVLRELAERAQFIVITHNKRTMAIADSLFGVTMEEPGVSKLISVRLADLQMA